MSQITGADQNAVLEAARDYARRELKNDHSGHDWWHAERVAATAETIARAEGADEFVCTLAAILHDVADYKVAGSEEGGLARVRAWLEGQGLARPAYDNVLEIISTMSFRGGNRPPMRTLEGRVVQDADRLDAMGAIGIARTFAYGGAHARPIHDPEAAPRAAMTEAQYRESRSTGINHFHEKLLKLRDLMNTETARKMAQGRHRFMEEYLARFDDEWAGRK
ncbi:MAG: HD domain-containing protein [Bacillota bacterium]